MIAPEWLTAQGLRKVLEGQFSDKEIKSKNEAGYNVYFFPNHPKNYQGGTVDGTQIDTFNFVFVDFDLKSATYPSKDSFLERLASFELTPSRIVDSGNGIHAYWRVTDLEPNAYLRLTRRLARYLDTDTATGSICQLMRLAGTLNTKIQNAYVRSELLHDDDSTYTCEQFDKILPPISMDDEQFCEQHYAKIYSVDRKNLQVDDSLPPKFGALLKNSPEAKAIWAGNTTDRSKDDYRLGHLMFANDFTKEEAIRVLVNSAKAMARAPIHRIAYAENIADKIWTFEALPTEEKAKLSSSVADILHRSGDTIKGVPFRCHKRIDNTIHGFRLGQVLGLVAGSGVGKTAFALNMFRWFAQENPDYHQFFVPLEQPANEIADRWKTMSGTDTSLHSKVHVLSNYDADGNFRHLSFDEIKDYVLEWQKETGNKVGCIVIDHIGALKKKNSSGENQDLMDICHSMKAFAVQTNTLLVMQSQAPREKAGIGDLELNKDAAYGTVYFEAYCDYLISLWQPLKRCHNEEMCPTVTAFKFCKIRHKKAKLDIIKEDVPYFLAFDSEKELMEDMTQEQETAFNYFLPKATNARKADRKTDIVKYQSVPYKEGVTKNVQVDSDRLNRRH